jgi:hypothetical protein
MFCIHSSEQVFSLFLQDVVVLYFHVPPLKKQSHPPSNHRLPKADEETGTDLNLEIFLASLLPHHHQQHN